jgi:glycine betaine/proline transport system permease protein
MSVAGTDMVLEAGRQSRKPKLMLVVWLAALASVYAVWMWGKDYLPWAFKVPRDLRLPARTWIGNAMNWLVDSATFGLFTFTELTRFLAGVVEAPYRAVLSLLSTGVLQGQGSDAVQLLPPLSWIAVMSVVGLLGYYAGGRKLALLVTVCFGFIALFGQWNNAMITLASILIAVPLGAAGGLLLGIAAWRWPIADMMLRPVLDLMQTIPVFAYLVPILVLFGFGPTAAIIATIIYAMPPMTRITTLALRGVAPEISDLGNMVGCTRRQMVWKVMVPSAMQSLMVGINQVIMLSLNMVIIASMIGAGGLGYEVLTALRRLDIGTGVEAGFAIVALAVALDRLSQALAQRSASPLHAQQGEAGLLARHPYSTASIGVIILTGLFGLTLPALQTFPEAWRLTTGDFWNEVVKWINVNYFDQLEAVKNALLLNVMIPFKRFLTSLPWAGVAALVTLAGWSLGGWRLALLTGALAYLIAVTGQWEKAMITVYLCGISVVLACLIGIPIGMYTASSKRLWAWVEAAIDTLQTLPSFVYLMPAVMLFRVGDFTAMLAVVAYAVSPVIRYTALGLQRVPDNLIEAGRANGCTDWQLMTKIRLKLAMPEIMLGINQTVMLALSMLVITALVGTRDLGQEVYIALTKADSGRGLVAGLAVAFIAIIADRLITAGSLRLRARLGLSAQEATA